MDKTIKIRAGDTGDVESVRYRNQELLRHDVPFTCDYKQTAIAVARAINRGGQTRFRAKAKGAYIVILKRGLLSRLWLWFVRAVLRR